MCEKSRQSCTWVKEMVHSSTLEIEPRASAVLGSTRSIGLILKERETEDTGIYWWACAINNICKKKKTS